MVYTCPMQANKGAGEEKFLHASCWSLEEKGRPKRTWMEIARIDLNKCNPSTNLAQDRLVPLMMMMYQLSDNISISA